MNYPWNISAIGQTIDVKTIRRAYAARLREIDRDDPAQLQRLVAARDAASAQAPKKDCRPNMRTLSRSPTGQIAERAQNADQSNDFGNVKEPNEEVVHIHRETEQSDPRSTANTAEIVVDSKDQNKSRTLIDAELLAKVDTFIVANQWRQLKELIDADLQLDREALNGIEARSYTHLLDVVEASNFQYIGVNAYYLFEGIYNWLSDPASAAKRIDRPQLEHRIVAELRDRKFTVDGQLAKSVKRQAGNASFAKFVLFALIMIVQISFMLVRCQVVI